jgi:hypothetical protein
MKLHFYFMLLIGVLICLPEAAIAQDSDNTLVATAAAASTMDTSQSSRSTAPPPASSDGGFFNTWFSMVSRTQAEQPHWITPLATTTPRLEQEFRYDVQWQPKSNGTVTDNYGVTKGLEIIPLERVEIILSVPPYIVHNNPSQKDGFGDFQSLIKFRILSSNEERGNYILTAFLSISAPTGQFSNGVTDPVITPTLAYGKGFGDFDIQGTIGVSLPAGNTKAIGRTVPWNNAFQYRIYKKIWPEIEVNYTYFDQGAHDGKTQVYLTPGVVLGKFHLWKRLGFTIGGGFQVATTHFNTSNHNGIFSVRFPF